MRHLRIAWRTWHSEDPAVTWSEVDENGELRKVDQYGDGRFDMACADFQTGEAFVTEGVVPSTEDINFLEEFGVTEISQDEFEAVWQSARQEDSKSVAWLDHGDL